MKKRRRTLGRQNIEPVLAEVKASLQKLYGKELGDVILFGSYARGEAHKESDIDLVVVLKKHPLSSFEEIRKMSDLINDVVLEHHHLLGVVPMSKEEWETSTGMFYRNVRKDGIPI